MPSNARQKETPEPISRKRLRKVLRGERRKHILQLRSVKPNLNF